MSSVNDDPLRCPRCAGPHLHHGVVHVDVRRTEDGPGQRVTVEPDPFGSGIPFTQTKTLRADSPLFAGRRNDLVVEFRCEDCPLPPHGAPMHDLRLVLTQRKGSTHLHWTDAAGRPLPTK